MDVEWYQCWSCIREANLVSFPPMSACLQLCLLQYIYMSCGWLLNRSINCSWCKFVHFQLQELLARAVVSLLEINCCLSMTTVIRSLVRFMVHSDFYFSLNIILVWEIKWTREGANFMDGHSPFSSVSSHKQADEQTKNLGSRKWL